LASGQCDGKSEASSGHIATQPHTLPLATTVQHHVTITLATHTTRPQSLTHVLLAITVASGKTGGGNHGKCGTYVCHVPTHMFVICTTQNMIRLQHHYLKSQCCKIIKIILQNH